MDKKITSFFIDFFVKRSKFLLPLVFSLVFFIFPFVTQAIEVGRTDDLLYKFKDSDKVYSLKTPEGRYNETMEYLRSLDDIEYVEPNYTYQAAIIPSDIFYNNQWYLKKIKAPEAWNEVRESPEIVIAIIDSGVQINHPDLRDNVWRNVYEAPGNMIDDDKNGLVDDVNGWDFVNNVADPSPKFQEGYTQGGVLHGTIVAGVAAASGNNATGITGVTWRAKIMPLKVLDDKGEGDTKNVIKAIDYAIDKGADVINFSFVGFNYSQSLNDAIRRAYEAGIIMVAAAGNEQDQGQGYSLDVTPMYPACHDGLPGENMVIGVAATDSLDQKAAFSSYGFNCVDISAPGVSFFSTSVYNPEKNSEDMIFNKYYDGYWSGTSMATPLVSAAAVLVEEANPRLTQKEVFNILFNSTDNINRLNPTFLGQLGSGRLNIEKAVLASKSSLYTKTYDLIFAPFSEAQAKISISDETGQVERDFLAYGENFRGGVNIAVGDVNGDGVDEIVTGAGIGGGPHIRIFTVAGDLLGQFFAYDKSFRGGVNVAVGDVNGDGVDEIVTGAGVGGGPQVRIFKASGKVEGQFFAYDKRARSGVRVAVMYAGDGVRNGQLMIIAAPGEGLEPKIKVFDNHAQLKNSFLAFDKDFIGGVNIAAGDFDFDGIDEIVTAAAGEGSPHVRIFNKKGVLLNSFYAFDKVFTGGVAVATIRVNK